MYFFQNFHFTILHRISHLTVFFIFSNTGGNDITKKALEHWSAGRTREDITLKEMEEILTIGAFNEQGNGF